MPLVGGAYHKTLDVDSKHYKLPIEDTTTETGTDAATDETQKSLRTYHAPDARERGATSSKRQRTIRDNAEDQGVAAEAHLNRNNNLLEMNTTC
jgi:hypothetical protein